MSYEFLSGPASSKTIIRHKEKDKKSLAYPFSQRNDTLIEVDPVGPGGSHMLILGHEIAEIFNPVRWTVAQTRNFIGGLFKEREEESSDSI